VRNKLLRRSIKMNRPPSPHPRRLKTIYEEEKMNKNITQDIVSILFKEVNELRDIVKKLEEEINALKQR
jgi:hypothetical protein